jgi:hypothetical protein
MKKNISHCRSSSRIQSKIVERGKFDNPSIHVHDRSLSWLSTSTSIKRGGVTLAVHGPKPI